jgi:hypothetical protein
LLALTLVLGSGAHAARGFSGEEWRRHVEALADPALEGRLLGSKGALRAAGYIEDRFREYGLEAPPRIGWRMRFPVALDLELDSNPAKNSLRLSGPASAVTLTLLRDYQPLPFSANGAFEDRQLAFAGYAISAPELGYDDFEGLDIRGKVVIAFRREPQERDAGSRFRGLDFTAHASFAAKANEVAKRGGAALILVTNRLPQEASDELPAFSTSTGPLRLAIPVLLAKADAVGGFFTEQGYDLSALVRRIDRDGKPSSFAFAPGYRAAVRATVKGKSEHGFNILGWKPGSSAEFVVVGAHYDHIGMGKRFSMEPGDRGKIHPGADDNASGVAAMLELARMVAQGPTQHRGVLFVAFGGEEHGLFGSSALLRQLPAEFGKLTGMINFDMVGRLRDGELFMAGLESVPDLAPVAEAAANRAGLRLERITDYPYNMSDHGNFLEAGIPAVLLFTGLHLEYHTARDTADRVNAEGAALILDVAFELLVRLTESADAPGYLAGKDPAYERNLRELATPPNPFQQE